MTSFAGLLPKLPGARVLPGNFQQTGIAVAVPKGRPAALKLASGLIEDAKKSGLVRRALDAAGFKDAEVAPLSSHIVTITLPIVPRSTASWAAAMSASA